uniref:Reverse transcriptase domain-containing protein n=1 Tax=Leptobrachium leishanense TaxID=445787 RepID=A0A8C5LLZ8_9ANUR
MLFFSRIDYLFMQQHQLYLLQESDIGVRTWSDHSPVWMTLSSPLFHPREKTWRMNTHLLDDPGFSAELSCALKHYFEDNVGVGEVPEVTVWEAHKAVMRGLLISKAAAQKKAKSTETADLLENIRRLEQSHHYSTNDTDFKEATILRRRLNDILNEKLRLDAARAKCYFALQENKPGKLLAQLLRQRRDINYISKIRTGNGQISPRPDVIVKEFETYYRGLYDADGSLGGKRASPDVSSYLRDKIHTTLTPEDSEMLSVPFTSGELVVVLKLMKAGKSPGPDGLPVEYYKHFAQDLLPRMLSVFNSVGADTSFHPHTIAATIAVIPKPGKDGSECKNYRPISLLNADAKIFAKLLAERLKPFLSKLIRPDQVGFIPGREARDATARAIGAVAYARQTGEGVILLSMDAEKAFDRVSWPFLFQVLHRMGLPDIFLEQVQALYTNPSARIRVNGALSAPIPIYNGTRQGCPLSPLLFALYLEPLLEAVRSTDSITGIRGASRSHVVSAYADDLLFMLTNVETSLPAVRKVLSAFGEVAGFRVNMDKSEILNVNLSQRCVTRLKRSVPFTWCTDRIKYLGIWIAPSPEQLYALNYQPLLDVFVSDLSGWTKKFISWTGRINTLKMNVVPRLLYVLQTVPISLPTDFFKRYRTAALRFIWPNGGPRVGYATLCRSKSDGGMALPDAKLYYYAVHLTRLLEWSLQKSEKLWLDLEEKLLGTPLWTLPWIRCQGPWEQRRTWCLTTETLGIWRRLRMQFGLTSSISPLLPLGIILTLLRECAQRLKCDLTLQTGSRWLHF